MPIQLLPARNSFSEGVSLPDTTGNAAKGLLFGSDTNLYRSAPNVLRTDDSLVVVSPAASSVPLTVQGATSQTGDLQQWQNSAGAVLARVNSVGSMRATDSFYVERIGVPTQNLRISMDGGIARLDSTGSFVFNRQAEFTTSVYVTGGNNAHALHLHQGASAGNNSTGVLAVFRNGASATADLTQWRDGAGATLAKVTSTGVAAFNNAYTANADAPIVGYVTMDIGGVTRKLAVIA